MPSDLSAWTADERWPGGGTVKVLKLGIGDSTITIWPADPDKINDLGNRLSKIACHMIGGVERMTFDEWLRTLPDEYQAKGYIYGLMKMSWDARGMQEPLTNPHNPDNSVSNESEIVEKK